MSKKIAIELGLQARMVLDQYCREHELPHVEGNSFAGRDKNQLWDFCSKGTLVATVDMTKKTVKIVCAKKLS
jgi:hypothetical protein